MAAGDESYMMLVGRRRRLNYYGRPKWVVVSTHQERRDDDAFCGDVNTCPRSRERGGGDDPRVVHVSSNVCGRHRHSAVQSCVMQTTRRVGGWDGVGSSECVSDSVEVSFTRRQTSYDVWPSVISYV